MKQPRCLQCGSKIRKRTSTVYFKQAHEAREETYRELVSGHRMLDQIALPDRPHGTRVGTGRFQDLYVDEIPKTKEQAARFVNGKIISLRRYHGEELDHVNVWDGESYEDPHFCKNKCAEKFGRRAARAGVRM